MNENDQSNQESWVSWLYRFWKRRLSVIPVQFGMKAPRLPKWTDYCLRLPTEREVLSWERQYKGTPINYGLVLGEASGLVALDFDVDDAEILQLCPSTPLMKRGARGFTAFFRYQTGVLSQKIGGVIDVLSHGKLTIIPPSRHPNGDDYLWLTANDLFSTDVCELPVLTPEMLEDLTEKVDRVLGRGMSASEQKIPEGKRNDTLFRFAALLRSRNLERDTIETLLYHINQERCTPPLAETEIKGIVKSVCKYQKGHSWGAVEKLPDLELNTKHLDLDLLPEVLRPYVCNQSEVLRVPTELVAVPLLSVIGAILARQTELCIFKVQSWIEVPNLWCMIIGTPGQKKTPVLKSILRSVEKHEEKIYEVFKKEWAKFEARRAELNPETKSLESRLKATKEGQPTLSEEQKAPLIERLAQIREELAKLIPVRPRFLIHDSTVEALQEIMSENERGLLYFRDELPGLILSLDKKGQEPSRKFLLEGWSGRSSYSVDRVGRGSIVIPMNRVTIIGGIQPEVLPRHFGSAFDEAGSDDGFVARFQLVVYAKTSDLRFSSQIVHVDKEAEAYIEQLFGVLLSDELSFAAYEEPTVSLRGVNTLYFDTDAERAFHAWRLSWEDVTKKQKSGALEALCAKYPKLLAGLSLIFHVLEHWEGRIPSEVSLVTFNNAHRFMMFLYDQAVEIYGGRQNAALRAAHLLSEKISEGKVPVTGTARGLLRNGWSGLQHSPSVMAALEILEDYGFLRIERAGQSVRYELNPQVVTANADTRGGKN